MAEDEGPARGGPGPAYGSPGPAYGGPGPAYGGPEPAHNDPAAAEEIDQSEPRSTTLAGWCQFVAEDGSENYLFKAAEPEHAGCYIEARPVMSRELASSTHTHGTIWGMIYKLPGSNELEPYSALKSAQDVVNDLLKDPFGTVEVYQKALELETNADDESSSSWTAVIFNERKEIGCASSRMVMESTASPSS